MNTNRVAKNIRAALNKQMTKEATASQVYVFMGHEGLATCPDFSEEDWHIPVGFENV